MDLSNASPIYNIAFNICSVLVQVVYFTVLGPFVILAVFLVRGAILPGADKGILFYLTPKPEKLLDTKVTIKMSRMSSAAKITAKWKKN